MRFLAILTALAAMPALAAPETSIRPLGRPGAAPALSARPASFAAPSAAPALEAIPASAAPRRPSLRPVPRGAPPRAIAAEAEGEAFGDWLTGFRARASAAGIEAEVLDAALANLSPDPEAIRRDRNQSEFSKTLWDYLASAASEARIASGRAALARHEALFDRIEEEHGVDRHVVAAIWGLESAYGTFRGARGVVRSMATLAHEGRRGAFFEAELLAALRIVQSGEAAPGALTGSWAGAMGHTQFMPTSYLAHAVDGNGDGRRDIWSDDPSDALASAAAYLSHHGWTSGQPWGVEVRLPEGFDHLLARRETLKSPSEWARLGVSGLDGRPVPGHGATSILLPAGHRGAAFMIFDNFAVIERYNTADSYVIGVGHLADRLRGMGPIEGGWPLGDRALTGPERRELQRRLTAKGFSTRGIDGRIGPLTIEAVRRYQSASRLVPDGYASPGLLERLR